MTTNNTYTVAGVSTKNGLTKARFSNDLATRLYHLGYSEHENILVVELPTAMTKMEAALHLKTLPEFQTELASTAIEDYIQKNTPKEPGQRGRPMKLPTLADIPTRGEDNRFLSKEARLALLAQLIADTIAKKEAAKAKIAARIAAKMSAEQADDETEADVEIEEDETEEDVEIEEDDEWLEDDVWGDEEDETEEDNA
jgi:hypothetical protein